MYKLIVALVLLAVSTSAGAIQVYLTNFSVVTNGGVVNGLNSNSATWFWDGSANLTSTGNLLTAFHVGGMPAAALIIADSVTDLSINTGTGTATATSYECIEGTFLPAVGFSGCGNYSFGANYVDESTTVWGTAPGFTLPGTDVSRTLSGDDTSFGLPQDISIYDMNLTSWDGTTLVIDNFTFTAKGGDPAPTGGSSMTFSIVNPVPIPAAVYLFGSALGLLGWMRRSRRVLSSRSIVE